MQKMFSNATVYWNQQEIAERDALISQCFEVVSKAWTELNPAVRFARVETPIIVHGDFLKSHVNEGFPMIRTQYGFLRPETTAGCVRAFESMFPMDRQRSKRMPFCVWQAGKSFRDETNPETMRATKLRLREFWQLEFELFVSQDTKADYINAALYDLSKRFGGTITTPDDLPHYSSRTLDWMFGELEVAGCSQRTDWSEGVIHEVSIGLDRLVSMVMK